jgi:hypothetical protein
MNAIRKLSSLRIYTSEGNEVIEIYSMTRAGDDLVMDCKILDAMRMDVRLPASEILNNLKILLKGLFPYMFFLPIIAIKNASKRKSSG